MGEILTYCLQWIGPLSPETDAKLLRLKLNTPQSPHQYLCLYNLAGIWHFKEGIKTKLSSDSPMTAAIGTTLRSAILCHRPVVFFRGNGIRFVYSTHFAAFQNIVCIAVGKVLRELYKNKSHEKGYLIKIFRVNV